MTNLPLPVPLCEDRLPDIVTVSRVVIGASIACEIDMPDTSMLGNGAGSLEAKQNVTSFAVQRHACIFLTQTHRRKHRISRWR